VFSGKECPRACETWNVTGDTGCRLAARLGSAIRRLAAITSNMNGIQNGLLRLLSTIGGFIASPLNIVTNIRELIYSLKTTTYQFVGMVANSGNVLKDLIVLLKDLIAYVASEGL
jgi:hypothetical protein